MWIMHDYSGYNEVRKYNVQGNHACPICGPEKQASYSPHLKNMVYQGHNKFLPIYYPIQGQDHKANSQQNVSE